MAGLIGPMYNLHRYSHHKRNFDLNPLFLDRVLIVLKQRQTIQLKNKRNLNESIRCGFNSNEICMNAFGVCPLVMFVLAMKRISFE